MSRTPAEASPWFWHASSRVPPLRSGWRISPDGILKNPSCGSRTNSKRDATNFPSKHFKIARLREKLLRKEKRLEPPFTHPALARLAIFHSLSVTSNLAPRNETMVKAAKFRCSQTSEQKIL